MKGFSGDLYYVGVKLDWLNSLEAQIISASPSVLCSWEKIGLLNVIHEIKLAQVDPVEQVEDLPRRKVEAIA